MVDIDRVQKNLDTLEKQIVKNPSGHSVHDKDSGKQDIIKQLNYLITKSELDMFEKHFTSDMLTKPVTEPAKAIAKPAITVGKKVGEAAGRLGRAVSGWAKGVGSATKTGASTWKAPQITSIPTERASTKSVSSVPSPVKVSASTWRVPSNVPSTTTPSVGSGNLNKPDLKPSSGIVGKRVPKGAKKVAEAVTGGTPTLGPSAETAKMLGRTSEKLVQ